LSSKSKKDFLENVPRDSPQHKINGFLDAIPDFIDEMNHAESLRHGKVKITSGVVHTVRDLCFLLALIINGIILFQYKYVAETLGTGATTLKPILSNESSDYILDALGIAMIGL